MMMCQIMGRTTTRATTLKMVIVIMMSSSLCDLSAAASGDPLRECFCFDTAD